jgi:hypothetical protein
MPVDSNRWAKRAAQGVELGGWKHGAVGMKDVSSRMRFELGIPIHGSMSEHVTGTSVEVTAEVLTLTSQLDGLDEGPASWTGFVIVGWRVLDDSLCRRRNIMPLSLEVVDLSR